MTFTYMDFLRASYRNLIVCKELLSIMKCCEPHKKSQILHKVYYLSGYIIEFCYKYALFSSLNASKFESIYNFKDEDFKNKWKKDGHNFDKLKNVCSEYKIIFSSDIPYFGNNKLDEGLYNLIISWNVQIRYSLKLSNNPISKLNENDVIRFVHLCEDILKKITEKYN